MSDHGITVKRIWFVFWLLLVVTTAEVALGIIKPEFMLMGVLGTSLLNLTFIVLTLVKAFYIVCYFMHFKYEGANMRWTIALPALILIPYLVFILLVEGGYIYRMVN